MAKLFKTDGTIKTVFPQNGKTFTLDELQGYVDGDIECVQALNKLIFVMNDEGKLRGLEVNIKATAFYKMAFRSYDLLVGNVLVCRSKEME